MTVLSDHSILRLVEAGELVIDPFDPARVQPASYDLSLDAIIYIPPCEDMDKWYYWKLPLQIPGRSYILASTRERLVLPHNVIARVEGRSSAGRQGIIPVTAGYIDPGFAGQVTLEIANMGCVPQHVTTESGIGQFVFEWVDRDVLRPYGSAGLTSRYQNQEGVTRAREVTEHVLVR